MTQSKNIKLTAKQELFCQKVVEGRSLSDAYRITYNTAKMKGKTINNKAWELSKNGEITGRLKELRHRAIAKHDVTVENVIREIMKIAFLNTQDLFDDKGELIPIHLLPRDTAAAVASMEVTLSKIVNGKEGSADEYEYLKKIKTNDKLKGLELLGRYLAMFTDKVLDLTPREVMEEAYHEQQAETARAMLEKYNKTEELTVSDAAIEPAN
jgi:phage terminase small subunit